MTLQNSNYFCPHRVYCTMPRTNEDELCLGINGDFKNCRAYADLEEIREKVSEKTPDRKRSIVAILTENPIEMKGGGE